MRFDSKSGIVTGGGSGMGREVVNLVTQQGGEVLIVDQNEKGRPPSRRRWAATLGVLLTSLPT
jgi:NAD(P)-dependent dehydrogenase (short-subunit alcohol dehydrogenase family)